MKITKLFLACIGLFCLIQTSSALERCGYGGDGARIRLYDRAACKAIGGKWYPSQQDTSIPIVGECIKPQGGSFSFDNAGDCAGKETSQDQCNKCIGDDDQTVFVDAGCKVVFDPKIKVDKCGYRHVCDIKSSNNSTSLATSTGNNYPASAMSDCQRKAIKVSCHVKDTTTTATHPEECPLIVGGNSLIKKIYSVSLSSSSPSDKSTSCAGFSANDSNKLMVWGKCDTSFNVDADVCASSCKMAGENAANAGECCKTLNFKDKKCEFTTAEIRKIADLSLFENSCKAHIGLTQDGSTSTSSTVSTTNSAGTEFNPQSLTANTTTTSIDAEKMITETTQITGNSVLNKMLQLAVAKIEILGTFFVVMDESDHKGAEKIKALISKNNFLQIIKDLYHERHIGLKFIDDSMKVRMDEITDRLQEYLNLFKITISRELTADEKKKYEANEFYEKRPEYLAPLLAQIKILEAKIAFNELVIKISLAFGNDLVKAHQVATNFVWDCAFKSNCSLRTWIINDARDKGKTDFYLEPSFAYMAQDPSPIKYVEKNKNEIISQNAKDNFMSWVDTFVGYSEYYDFTRNEYIPLSENKDLLNAATTVFKTKKDFSLNSDSRNSTEKTGMSALFDFYFKDKPVTDLTKDEGGILFCSDEKERGVKIPYGITLGITHIQEMNLFLIDYLDLEIKAMRERIKCIQLIYDQAHKATANTNNTQLNGQVTVPVDNNNSRANASTINGVSLVGDQSGIGTAENSSIPLNITPVAHLAGQATVAIGNNNPPTNSTVDQANVRGQNAVGSTNTVGTRSATADVAQANASIRNASIAGYKANLNHLNENAPILKKAKEILSSAMNNSFPSMNSSHLPAIVAGGNLGSSNRDKAISATGSAGLSSLAHEGNGQATKEINSGVAESGHNENRNPVGVYMAGESDVSIRRGGASNDSNIPFRDQALRASDQNFERQIQESDSIWTKISVMHERHIKPPFAE